ncbi:uncharacterized protein [Elaeis guineensis]|uniref:uncharacterized protein n=1 Tax=Elaeis guineensis var. tenera TaxID=51953 RepID=UPI003C6D6726
MDELVIQVYPDQEHGFLREPDGYWIVHIEGSSSSARSRADLLLLGLEGFVVEYTLRFDFSATNNETEYEALIMGLRIAKDLRVQNLRIRTDFQLVAGQVKGDYKAREESMKKYLQKKVKDLILMFASFDIQQVPE